MPRSPRIVYPGALYHVTSRGNERKAIFRSDTDRAIFLELLESTIRRFSWICHGYCLMGNHYHLLVETPKPNLARGMHRLNGCYAQSCNRRWSRVGHLFQGRYHGIVAEKEAYLLELVRYIGLNPVRAGWRDAPEEWPWGSYPALVGLSRAPSWLTTAWVLAQFAPDRGRARERLREFVWARIADPAPLPVRNDLYLGTDAFIDRVDARVMFEIEHESQPARPALETLFAESSRPLEAAREHGYTLREIADATGRHYSTISRRLHRAGSLAA